MREEKKFYVFIVGIDGAITMVVDLNEALAKRFIEVARGFDDQYRQIWLEEL